MSTRIGVATCAALGLTAVTQTALYYAGVDRFAFCIALVMGAVLCSGAFELWRVVGRTTRLQRELAALPASADRARIDAASPLLRALLSARLDRSALPVPAPAFAPYLLSLLVMLGLLGTFLGLFETLRGAALALDAGTDVQALRGGLKAPMRGLMRAFGTSAAGVASSAMLGLALVLVRRDAQRFSEALHATASGALARLAPAHRQLMALEALAEQGAAWPAAAAAMARAVEELKGLERGWRDAHAQAAADQQRQLAQATERLSSALERGIEQQAAAAEHTQRGLGQAASEIREAISRGVERAATTSREAVSPLLAQAAAEHGAALREHLGAVHDELRRAGAELARELAESASTVRAQLDRNQATEARHHARADEILARLGETSGVLGEAARSQTAALDTYVRATEERQQTRADEIVARLAEAAGALGEAARKQTDALGAFVHTSEERQHAHAEHILARLSETSGVIGEAARNQTGALDAFVRATEERQHAHSEQLLAKLSETSGVIGEAARNQTDALGAFVRASEERQREAEAGRDGRMTELLDNWHSVGRAQAERLTAFEGRLAEQQAGHAEALASRLHAHVAALQGPLAHAAELLEEASRRIQGGGLELQAVAESFAKAVASQREGARQWLESLGDIERYALEAGETAAADALSQHLARTHEVFDRQLSFQQALIDQLQGSQRHDELTTPRTDASA